MGIRAAWAALWGGAGVKTSAAAPAIAAFNVGQPVWTPRQYDKLAEEGYARCAVAFRCISEIAGGIASIPLMLKQGDKELEKHALIDLLKAPNPRQGGASLIQTLMIYHLIAGNSYLEAVRTGKYPMELWALRPDRMRVVPGALGVVSSYEYEANSRKVIYESDPVTGRSDTIMHLAEPHPVNDWYGLSAIEVAAAAIDQHNAYGAYNVALMQNQCRPSGAMVFRPIIDRMSGQTMSPPETFIQKAEEKLTQRHSGVANAGRPLVLSGDVDWLSLGLSPSEMSFIEGKLSSARDICMALGVPFVLVVTGDSTYNNRADARLELWEQTVLPLADRLVDRLNAWLVPQYGDAALRLEMDLDEIPALEPRRAAKWDRALTAFEKGVITRQEARAAMGYAEVPDGDGVFATDSAAAPNAAPDAAPDAATAATDDEGAGEDEADVETKVGRVLSARNERELVDARNAVRAADRKIASVVKQVQAQPIEKPIAKAAAGETEHDDHGL